LLCNQIGSCELFPARIVLIAVRASLSNLSLDVIGNQRNPECPYCHAAFDAPGVVRFKDSFRCPSCGIELQVSYAYKQLVWWVSVAVAASLCLFLHLRGGGFLLGFVVFLLPSVFSVTILLGRVYPPKLVI
jgi:hypothetical protein